MWIYIADNIQWVILSAIIATLSISIAIGIRIFRLGRWVGEVDKDRDSCNSFIDEIRSDIKRIFERLPSTAVASDSPIRLTDLGKKISKHLNANDWAKSEADKCFDKSKGMDSFEIQKFPFDYAQEYKPNDELLRKMRAAAFETGIDLDGVQKVLGVELRDCLLAKHSRVRDSLDI